MTISVKWTYKQSRDEERREELRIVSIAHSIYDLLIPISRGTHRISQLVVLCCGLRYTLFIHSCHVISCHTVWPPNLDLYLYLNFPQFCFRSSLVLFCNILFCHVMFSPVTSCDDIPRFHSISHHVLICSVLRGVVWSNVIVLKRTNIFQCCTVRYGTTLVSSQSGM